MLHVLLPFFIDRKDGGSMLASYEKGFTTGQVMQIFHIFFHKKELFRACAMASVINGGMAVKAECCLL